MECCLSWCHKEVETSGLCSGHRSNKFKHGVPNPPVLAHIVGTRTIVAKTCLVCGELKLAKAFPNTVNRGRRYKKSTCTPCVVQYNKDHPPHHPELYGKYKNTEENRRRNNKANKDINNKSREAAHHHYAEWTTSELELIERTDLTDPQKAKLLGRTVKAVNNKRRRMRRAAESNASVED